MSDCIKYDEESHILYLYNEGVANLEHLLVSRLQIIIPLESQARPRGHRMPQMQRRFLRVKKQS